MKDIEKKMKLTKKTHAGEEGKEDKLEEREDSGKEKEEDKRMDKKETKETKKGDKEDEHVCCKVVDRIFSNDNSPTKPLFSSFFRTSTAKCCISKISYLYCFLLNPFPHNSNT